MIDRRTRDLSEVRPKVRPHDLDCAYGLLEDVFGCYLWVSVNSREEVVE
jgi:hypothetical protein